MNWISVRFYGMSDTILKSYTIKSTFFLMVQNNDKKKTVQYVEKNYFFSITICKETAPYSFHLTLTYILTFIQ